MKNEKNIISRLITLVFSTIGAGVTTFSMLLLLFKTEEVVSILFSKSVVLATGIMIGAVVGFITGAICAYRRASKELISKEELAKKQELKIARLNQQLADSREYTRTLIQSYEETRMVEKERSKRCAAIWSQIADFPTEAPSLSKEEEEITHPQEETSDDET